MFAIPFFFGFGAEIGYPWYWALICLGLGLVWAVAFYFIWIIVEKFQKPFSFENPKAQAKLTEYEATRDVPYEQIFCAFMHYGKGLKQEVCETRLYFGAEGIHTAVDTCGFVPRESLDKVIPHTDIFLYDIKHIDDAKHREGTGQGNALILDNLKHLAILQKPVEIRIPLIPGYNDDAIDAIGALLSQYPNITKVRLLRYHNLAVSKYDSLSRPHQMPPLSTDDRLSQSAATLRRYGLTVIA